MLLFYQHCAIIPTKLQNQQGNLSIFKKSPLVLFSQNPARVFKMASSQGNIVHTNVNQDYLEPFNAKRPTNPCAFAKIDVALRVIYNLSAACSNMSGFTKLRPSRAESLLSSNPCPPGVTGKPLRR